MPSREEILTALGNWIIRVTTNDRLSVSPDEIKILPELTAIYLDNFHFWRNNGKKEDPHAHP